VEAKAHRSSGYAGDEKEALTQAGGGDMRRWERGVRRRCKRGNVERWRGTEREVGEVGEVER